MVLCLLALPVLLVLGIFSVKYRRLAKDALHCLSRTVTFRKCESGLDDRIRAGITGSILKFSPSIARIVYQNYKLLSWLFVILMVWSAYASSVGFYNYYYYGNCNGPESTGFCLFDPTGQNTKLSDAGVGAQKEIVLPSLEADDPIIGGSNASLTIIEFGCYSCPYTKKAEPTVAEVLEYYKGRVNVQFKNFPIPHHNMSFYAALAADCALEQGVYKPYHDALFAQQEFLTNSSLRVIAGNLGLNTTEFEACLAGEKFKDEIESDRQMGIRAGVAGTPTFFINGQKIVGPKPFKTFKTVIDEELKNV